MTTERPIGHWELANDLAEEFNIPAWDARHRVEWNAEELGYDADRLTADQIAEITRCIAADLKAGK